MVGTMLKKYKATTDFKGIFTFKKGEVKKMDSNNIHVKDLVKAKLLEEVKIPKKSKKK